MRKTLRGTGKGHILVNALIKKMQPIEWKVKNIFAFQGVIG
jgi:hypothetical protein